MRSDYQQAKLARTIVTRLSPERLVRLENWLRGGDLNPRPLGYEPNELPDCSTPRQIGVRIVRDGRTARDVRTADVRMPTNPRNDPNVPNASNDPNNSL